MPTAVIYARFSCSKQREASIEDQLRVCRAWCEREGYAVAAEYCDRAISGRTDDRPEFQRMLANAGESDIVLVYMMDRFSRDAYDAPIYKKRLRDKGVRVVSATEAMPDGPEAILIEKMYEGLAAVESAHISERTKRGMEGNALKCMHNGVKVFGYSFGADGKYEVNEEEAELVRECFARRISGEPVNSISRDLARRGVRTYAGNPAGHTFVRNMIRNEKYAGVYSWGSIRVEGGMPAIIGRGDWEMAQKAPVKKSRDSEEWKSYALAGKAVCEGCGRNLIGASARGRHNVRYEYYRCGGKCGVKPIRADWLEEELAARVRSIIADRETAMEVARIVARFAKDDGSAARAEKARERQGQAEKAVRNLTNAVAQGMPYEDVREDMERWKAQAAAAYAEASLYEEAGSLNVEDFADFLQYGATLDDPALIDAMVGQVMVGEKHVTAVLNYDVKKGQAARITFDRVRADLPLGCEKDEPANLPVDSQVRVNCDWLPKGTDTRIIVMPGAVAVEFPRVS